MSTSNEPVFDEPWQARAFALAVSLHERGLFSWTEWSDTLASEIAARPALDYYGCWLAALESIAVRHEAVNVEEINTTQTAWLAAAARTPHGQSINLDTE